MKITETHKTFVCGSKGRVTIFADSGEIVVAIITKVQKARKFCEANPETREGIAFSEGLAEARRLDLEAAVAMFEADPNLSPETLADGQPVERYEMLREAHRIAEVKLCDRLTVEAGEARRLDLKAQMEEKEDAAADTVGTEHEDAIDELLRFQNENADELLALGLRVSVILDPEDGCNPPENQEHNGSVPVAPVLLGSNPDNTALRSAQKKLGKLYDAAIGADPIAALLAIRTSRGNKYLNTCDDYRASLLAYFGADLSEAA